MNQWKIDLCGREKHLKMFYYYIVLKASIVILENRIVDLRENHLTIGDINM